MTKKLPWEKDPEPEPVDLDPFAFVRLRIQHGERVMSVGIRADDKDITGKIKLDGGGSIVISVWGVPTASEKLMTAVDVMKEIVRYVEENKLTPID